MLINAKFEKEATTNEISFIKKLEKEALDKGMDDYDARDYALGHPDRKKLLDICLSFNRVRYKFEDHLKKLNDSLPINHLDRIDL